MQSPQPLKKMVLLHLDVGSDPISGRIVSPDGTAAAFTGWMQLAAAIERAHEGERRPEAA
jgi:hypothetical protein